MKPTDEAGGESLDDFTVVRFADLKAEDHDAPLLIRRATRRPADLRLPPPAANPTDSLPALLSDRASR